MLGYRQHLRNEAGARETVPLKLPLQEDISLRGYKRHSRNEVGTRETVPLKLPLQEDISLRGYRRHLTNEAAPDPLSKQEEEMKEIKESETRSHIF